MVLRYLLLPLSPISNTFLWKQPNQTSASSTPTVPYLQYLFVERNEPDLSILYSRSPLSPIPLSGKKRTRSQHPLLPLSPISNTSLWEETNQTSASSTPALPYLQHLFVGRNEPDLSILYSRSPLSPIPLSGEKRTRPQYPLLPLSPISNTSFWRETNQTSVSSTPALPYVQYLFLERNEPDLSILYSHSPLSPIPLSGKKRTRPQYPLLSISPISNTSCWKETNQTSVSSTPTLPYVQYLFLERRETNQTSVSSTPALPYLQYLFLERNEPDLSILYSRSPLSPIPLSGKKRTRPQYPLLPLSPMSNTSFWKETNQAAVSSTPTLPYLQYLFLERNEPDLGILYSRSPLSPIPLSGEKRTRPQYPLLLLSPISNTSFWKETNQTSVSSTPTLPYVQYLFLERNDQTSVSSTPALPYVQYLFLERNEPDLSILYSRSPLCPIPLSGEKRTRPQYPLLLLSPSSNTSFWRETNQTSVSSTPTLPYLPIPLSGEKRTRPQYPLLLLSPISNTSFWRETNHTSVSSTPALPYVQYLFLERNEPGLSILYSCSPLSPIPLFGEKRTRPRYPLLLLSPISNTSFWRETNQTSVSSTPTLPYLQYLFLERNEPDLSILYSHSPLCPIPLSGEKRTRPQYPLLPLSPISNTSFWKETNQTSVSSTPTLPYLQYLFLERNEPDLSILYSCSPLSPIPLSGEKRTRP